MGSSCAACVLIADVCDADAIGLVGRNLLEPFIVVGKRQHDHPGLFDCILLENVEGIHRRDAKIVGLVGEGEGGRLGRKLPGRGFVTDLRYRKEWRVV
ncbi:MAG: hypothetical protein ABIZ80_16775 [Bryobacteraceae bacterium]